MKYYGLGRWMSRAVFLPVCLLAGQVSAQKPEKVYSVVKETQPREWYEAQIKAWKNEVAKQPKNADAWYNYYLASRMVRIYDEQGNTETSEKRFRTLAHIVDGMEKMVPSSFEYNYVKWHNGSLNPKLFPFLEKAYKIAPERPETYADLATYYEVRRDSARRDRMLQRWFASQDPIPGLLNYNYNVLQSIGEPAILVTYGDNDTYPAWMLQSNGTAGKGVYVLNMHLLAFKEYRERIFTELGLDPLPLDPEHRPEDRGPFNEIIIRHLAGNRRGLPVYLAVTAAVPSLTEPVKDRLYLVGLAYLYSAEKIDNMALLRKNFEQRFALDYLVNRFRFERFQGVVDIANANYVVPMMHLYEHYLAAGEQNRAEHMKTLALAVSRPAGMEAEVTAYFNKTAR